MMGAIVSYERACQRVRQGREGKSWRPKLGAEDRSGSTLSVSQVVQEIESLERIFVGGGIGVGQHEVDDDLVQQLSGRVVVLDGSQAEFSQNLSG